MGFTLSNFDFKKILKLLEKKNTQLFRRKENAKEKGDA